jgi:hypothetical protein
MRRRDSPCQPRSGMCVSCSNSPASAKSPSGFSRRAKLRLTHAPDRGWQGLNSKPEAGHSRFSLLVTCAAPKAMAKWQGPWANGAVGAQLPYKQWVGGSNPSSPTMNVQVGHACSRPFFRIGEAVPFSAASIKAPQSIPQDGCLRSVPHRRVLVGRFPNVGSVSPALNRGSTTDGMRHGGVQLPSVQKAAL